MELLDLVQLPSACADRLPGGLSGGQKQRVNLARAFAAEPDLILCDEVTSALDTVVGAAILDLMASLRRELGVSYMFISHDLNTVRAVCDDIVVLYAGNKVESVPRASFGGRGSIRTSSCWRSRCRSCGADGSTRSDRRGWRAAADRVRVAQSASSAASRALPAARRRRLRQHGAAAAQARGGVEILCHRSEPS
jgi:peptide/nickel transport system ATP-binding protein